MKTRTLTLLLLVWLVQACQPITDVCEEDKKASAIIYSFPDSIYANTNYELPVHFIIENSCGTFLSFSDSSYNTTTEVKAIIRYEGCNCNLNFVEDSVNYSIYHDSAGYYNYKFYVGSGDYDSYVLKVVN